MNNVNIWIIYLQRPLVAAGFGLLLAALAVRVLFVRKEKLGSMIYILVIIELLLTIVGVAMNWRMMPKDSTEAQTVTIRPATDQTSSSQQEQEAFESGLLAEDKMDYKNALLHYGNALELEPNRPEYLLAAGRTARKAGEYKQARGQIEQLLNMLETEGKNGVDLAEAQNELALLDYDQANYAKAETLGRHSLAIREQALGKEHPAVAQSLNNLAEACRQQGKYEEAEALHQRALAIREQTLGKEHPTVAESMNNLALLYKAQRNYAEAEALHQRALAIREQTLGKEHPAVAESMNNLASIYYQQGRYQEAELLHQRALAIREQTLGKEHPAVAESMNNLALLYKAQRNYAEAESLYQRSMAILKAFFPDGHPDIARCQANYDELKRKMPEQK